MEKKISEIRVGAIIVFFAVSAVISALAGVSVGTDLGEFFYNINH